MTKTAQPIKLPKNELRSLTTSIKRGTTKARTQTRARILDLLHRGQHPLAISSALHVSLLTALVQNFNKEQDVEKYKTVSTRYGSHFQLPKLFAPEPYATTIHRTGEADPLIENFLRPEAANPLSNLDTSQCPDCHGNGMYGCVAKINLRRESSSSALR